MAMPQKVCEHFNDGFLPFHALKGVMTLFRAGVYVRFRSEVA